MPSEPIQVERKAPRPVAPVPTPWRVLDWALHVWRPAASGLALMLALLLGWHVINGKHGISVWQQKRAEEQSLQKEIDDLQQENGRLRVRVERLQYDPHEIEHEAREKMRYVKPNEIIVAMPPRPHTELQPAKAQPDACHKLLVVPCSWF